MSIFDRLFARAPRIEIVKGDITEQHVNAIVNAAKSTLLGGGGVDGAIHQAAGPSLLAACRELRATTHPDGLPVGDAVATHGGALTAPYVIHTVGPRYERQPYASLLQMCYSNSLKTADALHCRTVAFPLISAGVYGWPIPDAIVQALTALRSTRTRHVKTARLVLFDDHSYRIARAMIQESF